MCPETVQSRIKCRLHEFFNLDKDLTEDDYRKIIPTRSLSQVNALKFIKNPYKMCRRVHSLVQSLTSQLRQLMKDPNCDPTEQSLYHNESLDLMVHRWCKLEKDFQLRNGKFDISLIPDIYDCIKYDFFHNSQLNLRDGQELYKCAKALADVVVPQEYGITKDEKLQISRRTGQHLSRKLLGDLRHADQPENMHRLDPKYSRDIVTPHRHVRTRLYFTSESHIHTMVNAIRYGNLCDDVSDEFWKRTMEYFSTLPELNYMTQIVLMLYEDPQADKTSDKRFHIELHFSPGVKCNLEEAAAKTPGVLLEACGNADSFDGAEVNADSKKTLPTAVKRRPRSDSDDEVVLRVPDKSWQERQTAEETKRNVSPRQFGNRSLSECESLKPGVAENRGKYKAISKSLESVTIQKESKSSYYPIQTSLSDELQDRQPRDHLDEHSKNLRVTISSPTLLKTQRGASSLIAALGPVFSVPGVRKLALQSAVPMANVVARQKLPLSTDERFLPHIPDHQVHSVLSSIHPVKTLHGCIPLRQMENFLKEISNFHAPELTPDLHKRRMAPKGLQLKPEKKGSPMARDLAASIPIGEDGIDMAEFECCENYVEKVTTV